MELQEGTFAINVASPMLIILVDRPQTIRRRGHQIPHDAAHRHGPHQRQRIQETRGALRQRRPSLLLRVPRRDGQAAGVGSAVPIKGRR